jgi:hypothetical protein
VALTVRLINVAGAQWCASAGYGYLTYRVLVRVVHAEQQIHTQTSTCNNSTNLARVDEALAALELHDQGERPVLQ